ncbi:MAG: hypothetical protein K9H84_00975 [Bacteroidales bacterium]|nr:hypothetical protein [Bacteroidales bacterium]
MKNHISNYFQRIIYRIGSALFLTIAIFIFLFLPLTSNGQKALREVVVNDLQKFVFMYDDNFNTTSREDYERASVNDKWEISDKERYSMLSNNKPMDKVVYRKGKDGKMLPEFRIIYAYNEHSQVFRKEMFYHREERWQYDRDTEFQYTSDHKLDSVFYYKKEGQIIFLSGLDTYDYDKNGRKVLFISHDTKDETYEPYPVKKTTYQYKYGQLQQKIKYYKSTLGETKGQWVKNRKEEHSYDQENFQNSTIRSRYKDDKWIPMTKTLQFTDARGRKYKQLVKSHIDDKWQNYTKTEFSFLDVINTSDYIYPYLEQEKGENPFDIEGGIPSSANRFLFEPETSQWKAKEKVTFIWE